MFVSLLALSANATVLCAEVQSDDTLQTVPCANHGVTGTVDGPHRWTVQIASAPNRVVEEVRIDTPISGLPLSQDIPTALRLPGPDEVYIFNDAAVDGGWHTGTWSFSYAQGSYAGGMTRSTADVDDDDLQEHKLDHDFDCSAIVITDTSAGIVITDTSAGIVITDTSAGFYTGNPLPGNSSFVHVCEDEIGGGDFLY